MVMAFAVASWGQRYRVSGYVLDNYGNMPNVNIRDNKGVFVGTTDKNGYFDFKTNADSLMFSFVGYRTQVISAAQGQKIIVTMMEDATLSEVVVKGKFKSETIGRIPPVAKGNWMPYNIPIYIPKRMFHGNNRFVFQPTLTNMTTGKSVYLRPLVLDGKKYDITQTRMYDYSINRDSLDSYRIVLAKADSGRIALMYKDSVYLDNPRDAFTLNIYKSYENYHKVTKMDSLTDYIRGSINPLKFLDYSFSAYPITDQHWLPKPNKQFMDTEGLINLKYDIGKSTLDTKKAENKSELDRLENELKMLEHQEGVTLQSFNITGTASPDGGSYRNQELSKARMRNALNYILNRLDPKTRALISISSDASVMPWTALVTMLKNDTLSALAEQIEKIIQEQPSVYDQWRHIRKLDQYKMIAEKYLPLMRTVRYKYTYTIFRNRNIDEIRTAHKAGEMLSMFEYWRLYSEETDMDRQEKLCREALAKYPDFMVAANDLERILIKKGQADDKILEPFVHQDEIPDAVKLNYIIALLANNRFSDAYLMSQTPMRKNQDTRLIKAYVNAFNNNYTTEDRKLIEASNGMNAILMKLNAGENKEALAEIMGVENLDAKGFYIKAICCNRNNLLTLATESLKQAIKMDPKLDNVAKTDADIYNVYKGLYEKGNNTEDKEDNDNKEKK